MWYDRCMFKRMPSALKRRLPAFIIILLLTACTAANNVKPTDPGPSTGSGTGTSVQDAGASTSSATGNTATEQSTVTEQSTTVTEPVEVTEADETTDTPPPLDENGSYTTKDEVALYIHTYGHLPGNFITKKEAEALGWDSSKGNLHKVAPGKSIGGDKFGNYEGNLPDGHRYKECDIDYEGGYRGAKRIVFSDDGLVFYTEDHYNTFEQLY